jgi:hypothetical protein
VHSRFAEPRGELIILFPPKESELADQLRDETLRNNFAFLAVISQTWKTDSTRVRKERTTIFLRVMTKLTLLKEN